MLLGPFDEVGDDQEVARKAHSFDDAKLELQPLFVLIHRRRMRDNVQSRFQSFDRLAPQLLNLIFGKLGQDRVAQMRPNGTAPRNLDRVLNSLRQIREQLHHFVLRLEVVLRRQLPARARLIHIRPIGNTDQGIMRLEHIAVREVDVIGRHERNVARIGHFDEGRLCRGLSLRTDDLTTMALQLDIEPVAKDRRQPVQ